MSFEIIKEFCFVINYVGWMDVRMCARTIYVYRIMCIHLCIYIGIHK